MTKMPTYFISHGGGPWPWMSEATETYQILHAALTAMPSELPAPPDAILMVSGHWEESIPTLMSNAHPGMLYDYGGFPEHTYHIKYPAPGSPQLCARVQALFKAHGIESKLDDQRAYDHGTFTPLAVAFPDARVPVVQLSIRRDYDPAAHLAIGRALAPLRNQGILIIGSGLSYHNLRAKGTTGAEPSHQFDAWLRETVITSGPDERTRRLIAWESAPSARLAHPRADHLVPLMVAAGAAETEAATLCYGESAFFGGLAVSSFKFG